jgi:hypothetical protein
MPKYFYICASCNKKCSFYHAMIEKMNDCLNCGCINSLKKIPTTFSFDTEKKNNKKVGEIVRDTIKEFHDELEQQKKELKDEYHESNE